MNSPIPEKWYKKDGSISIDDNGTTPTLDGFDSQPYTILQQEFHDKANRLIGY
ncbi:hypothetical protein [Peribacillus loiseleuriae]|uniref:hypothetical protein n=1 Tax=Peribacillus loiseleuriae TaxID=1679170 RepID=UPI003CFE5DA2